MNLDALWNLPLFPTEKCVCCYFAEISNDMRAGCSKEDMFIKC